MSELAPCHPAGGACISFLDCLTSSVLLLLAGAAPSCHECRWPWTTMPATKGRWPACWPCKCPPHDAAKYVPWHAFADTIVH